LLRAGNLVNVTSLFYLVPPVTALLDYALLGNRLSTQGCCSFSGIGRRPRLEASKGDCFPLMTV
jgi:hypothetical protein